MPETTDPRYRMCRRRSSRHRIIERLIRTINERLIANKNRVVSKDKSGLAEILFALRMYPSAKGKSAYEKYTRGEPNTIKKLVVNLFKSISDHPTVDLKDTDFESGQDSTILVRERKRGTRLEGAYKKRKGVLLEHVAHARQPSRNCHNY